MSPNAFHQSYFGVEYAYPERHHSFVGRVPSMTPGTRYNLVLEEWEGSFEASLFGFTDDDGRIFRIRGYVFAWPPIKCASCGNPTTKPTE